MLSERKSSKTVTAHPKSPKVTASKGWTVRTKVGDGSGVSGLQVKSWSRFACQVRHHQLLSGATQDLWLPRAWNIQGRNCSTSTERQSRDCHRPCLCASRCTLWILWWSLAGALLGHLILQQWGSLSFSGYGGARPIFFSQQWKFVWPWQGGTAWTSSTFRDTYDTKTTGDLIIITSK